MALLFSSSYVSIKASNLVRSEIPICASLQGNAKEKLQKLVFPKGMTFNKEKEVVLTPETNAFFKCFAEFSRGLGTKGGSDSPFFFAESLSAERAGFEPAVPCGTQTFQACTFGHSDTSPNLNPI